MNRTDILCMVADAISAESYCEIGVRRTRDNFDRIPVIRKYPVDPALFGMTSDEWFASDPPRVDLYFIDGDHSYEQSFRDIANARTMLNSGGVIACHDVWPVRGESTESRQNKRGWCGEAWKSFCQWASVSAAVIVPHNHGVGLLWDIQPVDSAVVGNLPLPTLRQYITSPPIKIVADKEMGGLHARLRDYHSRCSK